MSTSPEKFIDNITPRHGNARSQLIVEYFRREPDLDTQIRYIELTEKNGSVHDFSLAGDMWFEIAWHNNAASEIGATAMQNAITDWERAVQQRKFESSRYNELSGKAAIQLAHVPLYLELLYNHRLPSMDKTLASYQRLVDISRAHLEDQKHYSQSPNEFDFQTAAELRGNLNELYILLLLHRFGMRIDEISWLASPSLLSENRALSRRSARINPSWDISVFTQLDSSLPPKLTYKIQVKGDGGEFSKNKTYADDIIVINPRDDLRLGSPKTSAPLGNGTIVNECIDEMQSINAQYVTRKLDGRTEKLLDIMG